MGIASRPAFDRAWLDMLGLKRDMRHERASACVGRYVHSSDVVPDVSALAINVTIPKGSAGPTSAAVRNHAYYAQRPASSGRAPRGEGLRSAPLTAAAANMSRNA
jgi:hypothetical protein